MTITTIRESKVVHTALRLGAAVLLGWALSAAAQSQGQGTVVSVSISSPASGTVVTAPGNVTLTAAASINHPDWVVLRVEYYAGTALIGSATDAPYAFTWSNVAAGSYRLSAKAIATNPGQARQDPATHPNMPTWVGVSAPVTFRVQAVAQVYYIHPDHLNTPRFIADATQKIVWRWDQQEPFGSTPPNDDPDGDGVKFDFPLRFPGQYFDRETNLAYNYFRDYDPSIGRYVQSDPTGLQGGINTYAYVAANPLFLIDPTGQFTYNAPPPRTAPLPLDMEWKVTCLESCLGLELVITGGAERKGHKCPNSGHYSGDAVDFGFNSNSNISGRNKEFFCCAAKCGFDYGQTESNPAHYHLQIVPGCGVPKVPSDPCTCK